MGTTGRWTRRQVVSGAAVAGGGVLLACCGAPRLGLGAEAATQKGDDVTPGEDLMREHGVLRRVMLVYGECIRRLDAKGELPAGVVTDSARIISTFIEGYHEKLEENYLFVRFEKAGALADLTKTLRVQHEAGRALTGSIIRLSQQVPMSVEDRTRLAQGMQEFVRMYEPHAAREDTVLFPAMRRVYSAKEYDELGDNFEDKEHELFGDSGFEKMVEKVAGIERALDIYDLAGFTPKV